MFQFLVRRTSEETRRDSVPVRLCCCSVRSSPTLPTPSSPSVVSSQTSLYSSPGPRRFGFRGAGLTSLYTAVISIKTKTRARVGDMRRVGIPAASRPQPLWRKQPRFYSPHFQNSPNMKLIAFLVSAAPPSLPAHLKHRHCTHRWSV